MIGTAISLRKRAPIRRAAHWAAALAIAANALSCSKPDAPIETKRLTVFATIYPLAEMAREIGGNDVRVDWLIESGKPLAMTSLSRHDRDRLNSADFTLCDGFHRTETWAETELSQRQDVGRIITAETLPVVSSISVPGLLQLDPIVMRQYASALADRFAAAMPEHASEFQDRANQIVAQIDAVVARYPNSSFGNTTVAVLSGTYGCLLDRFGVASINVDFDVYRLSDADLSAIQRATARAGVTALLVPFDLPPGAVSRIEARTGLKSFAIDALGDGEFKGHDTYLGLLRYNLDQLQQATAKSAK